MKKIKIKIYQKIANFIVKRVENANSDREFNHWYNAGMNLNEYCIMSDIYLD